MCIKIMRRKTYENLRLEASLQRAIAHDYETQLELVYEQGRQDSKEIDRLREIEREYIRLTDRDAKGRFVKNEVDT